ncbi:MAG: hypothetical protein R3304_01025 [Longimicrobiales bacterium]|nr:hypothetical protein [Longimicrobiales bacterium]
MDTEPTFRDMARRLEARFRSDVRETWTDDEFEAWAHRVFAHQYQHCSPYRAFCRRRGVTPEGVTSWRDAPAVPATAFKHFDLVSGSGVEAIFRTSGTTRGREDRGRHLVPRLDLYRASLVQPFRRALLGDIDVEDVAKVPFLSLIPSPEEAVDSSLSFMVGSAAEQMGARIFWLVSGDGAWRWEAVEAAREGLAGDHAPALLLGTALSFVHLVEDVRGGGAPALAALAGELPPASRAMETGGFKGSRRRVSRLELHRRIQEVTGIPGHRIVNEYGMTELLSQLWEPILLEGPESRGLHRPPPWLRVQALDSMTLRAVPEGEPGLLAFFDLANLGSIAHVLTEDVGSVQGGRVRLQGRTAGAEPRGCSRAMDDLMSAASGG